MFIIHITKTHLFSFMKSFLILIASFGLAFNTYAAEKSLSPEDMPQGFKSGDAYAGSSLVESCVACHGTDGNSMNTDWPQNACQEAANSLNGHPGGINSVLASIAST